jgi:hypothetical protein
VRVLDKEAYRLILLKESEARERFLIKLHKEQQDKLHFNVAREVLKQEQKKLYNRKNRRQFQDLDEIEQQIFVDFTTGVKKLTNKKLDLDGKPIITEENDYFGEFGYHGEYIKNRALFDDQILMNNEAEH